MTHPPSGARRGGGGQADPAQEMRTVRLENLPVAALVAVRRHADNLLHELRLIASGLATGTLDAEVPRRLARLIAELNDRLASPRLISRLVVDDAAARGEETVTLALRLPGDAAFVIEQYGALLDEADEYCRRGQLLTLCLPAELVEFRRKLLDDIGRQLR